MKEGIQLLSPSLQRGLAYDNQQEVIPKRRRPPPPPPSSSFHFDRFTTESCQKRYIPPPPPSSDDSSPASPLYYRSQRSSYRHPSLHHSRSIDGATAPSSLTSSFMSYYKPPPSFHTRASLVSNTTTSSPIQVVMSGWFQRRRGKLIKRWKHTFLVLKADHQLCFYTNENTINGKLEERFEVLRITYQSSSSHVFQVIGIGREQKPFKEELRIIETGCLKAWIIAFRRYFDHASMEVAIEEMPELLLLPQVGEDEEEEEDEDEEEDYDFAAAVEEMVLRPFPFNEEENQEESIKMYQRQTITFDFKTECPIIERTSQVPMLERSGSESMISNSNSNWKLNQ